MQRRRGVALGTVLSVVTLLVLLGVALAAMATFGLSVAGNFYRGAQAEMIARAAMVQFISEQSQSVTSVLAPAAVDPLLTRYQSPVFPDGGTSFPGTAAITFETSQPWYSVDNSNGDVPAAGYVDLGTANHSVPPYSVDLVVSVTIGSGVWHFEALLQRRWPYAVTTPNQVSLFPMVSYGGFRRIANRPPSVVQGAVYVPGQWSGRPRPRRLDDLAARRDRSRWQAQPGQCRTTLRGAAHRDIPSRPGQSADGSSRLWLGPEFCAGRRDRDLT
jgi:hypothetical protein